MQNNPSLHLKLPDPSTTCTIHRSFYWSHRSFNCSLIHPPFSLLLFTDPSLGPWPVACILIDSLLPDQSLLGFFHEPSIVTSIKPSIAPLVISIAPSLAHWSIASAIHRSYDCSLVHRMHHPSIPPSKAPWSIHRLHNPSFLLLLPDPSIDPSIVHRSIHHPAFYCSLVHRLVPDQ